MSQMGYEYVLDTVRNFSTNVIYTTMSDEVKYKALQDIASKLMPFSSSAHLQLTYTNPRTEFQER